MIQILSVRKNLAEQRQGIAVQLRQGEPRRIENQVDDLHFRGFVIRMDRARMDDQHIPGGNRNIFPVKDMASRTADDHRDFRIVVVVEKPRRMPPFPKIDHPDRQFRGSDETWEGAPDPAGEYTTVKVLAPYGKGAWGNRVRLEAR